MADPQLILRDGHLIKQSLTNKCNEIVLDQLILFSIFICPPSPDVYSRYFITISANCGTNVQ